MVVVALVGRSVCPLRPMEFDGAQAVDDGVVDAGISQGKGVERSDEITMVHGLLGLARLRLF